MGTLLESLHVARPGWRERRSALRLADMAAHDCLQTAGVDPRDVDLVINTGIYRDRNLGEPAMAALIQEDLGINPEDPHPDGHGTFSFDVANGTCGPLSALQIVDGFLRAGTIGRALVVASDADPGHGLAVDFPFAAAGAAATCTWNDHARGLGEFHWSTDTGQGPLLTAIVEPVRRGNLLQIQVDPGFSRQAATVAAEPVGKALAAAGMQAADVRTTILAPGDPDFAQALCRTTGLSPDRVVAAAPEVHTASLLVALDKAATLGYLEPDAPILLVSAAAGVIAGACVYQP